MQLVIVTEGSQLQPKEKGRFQNENGLETEVAELLFPTNDHQIINLNFSDVLLHT